MNEAFIMVVFGATGDLARNKLVPALLSLFKQNKLPEDFHIIGFSRRDLTNKSFKDFFINLTSQKEWPNFIDHLSYQQGDFETIEGYKKLIDCLADLDKTSKNPYKRFLYLATPPMHYESILDFLNETGLSKGKNTRIVVEKPFGKDLDTAISLDKKLSHLFEEDQIFRVDHYLGKETVQNMVAFRFANGVFEPVWNKNYIDHVQITFAEEKGIGNRGRFFDGVGILRDVAQNHLMQLIAAVAMEQPRSFTKEALRDERAKVIKAIRPIEENDVSKFVVRGQYSDYTNERNVPSDSNTETFVAMKFFIDTPRLQNVPFYVRIGKKMPKNVVEISIVFIQQCHILFKEYGCPEIGNVLTIRIQPDEEINLRVIAKSPGAKLTLQTVNMKFSYQEQFKTRGIEAYDRVLLDIFAGDQMLFNRSDELASSWRFITKILNGWGNHELRVMNYESGTWGPREANKLIEKDGRRWL
ncbi:glucose-6-phosphate dehydrogenase [Candidatus Roizmanbacteria bacterium]|nr:glucose-6-phosphate dehydrogenase [Candidatus Roizmanbacteria bacterium]